MTFGSWTIPRGTGQSSLGRTSWSLPINRQRRSQLAVFDDAWWLDAMDRARGQLVITITAA